MFKLVGYLCGFVVILAVIGFAFFTMTTPNIPQTVTTRTLDPRAAFTTPTPVIPTPPTPATGN